MWSAIKASANSLRLYLFERGIGTPSTFPSGEVFFLGKVGEGVGPNGSRAIDVLQGIAATTPYGQIKAFFTTCAQELLKDGDKGAARLAKASTHWLRHTHASHAIAGGMPIEVAQQNLGHASLATTTVYVKTEEKRRMKAVKKFWEARAGR
jgi:integrase